MPGLSIMLPIAVGIALFFLVLFLWSMANGEYEDPEMMKYRLIMDDSDDADHSITRGGSENSSTGKKEQPGASSP